MRAARGVSDEMLDGQVRLGGTFRHIWPYGNIAISPHSNYRDLSQYRHNRSSLHPCSVRDGTRSLPHLPAGRALPNGQPEHWSMRQSLALAGPPDAQPQYAELGTKAGSEKGGILMTRERLVCLRTPVSHQRRLRRCSADEVGFVQSGGLCQVADARVGRHEWRPHISRIERCRRSMRAARGVSDEMLDGQVRLGGTFRHIWPYGNIAISPHSNYRDLSQYRHNRSSLHPCSVRDGTRSLPHLPAGRALPNGQPEHWSMRQSLALAGPPDAQPQYAELGTKAGSEKGGILDDAGKVGLLAYPRLSSTTTSTPLRRRSRLRSIYSGAFRKTLLVQLFANHLGVRPRAQRSPG